MKTTVSFKFGGDRYNVSGVYATPDAYYLHAKDVAMVVRHWIKKHYPNIKYWIRSHVYAGGSSVDVYVSDSTGNPVPNEVYEKITSFVHSLEPGRFNGMIDMYEYKPDTLIADDGKRIHVCSKYHFVHNSVPYGVKA